MNAQPNLDLSSCSTRTLVLRIIAPQTASNYGPSHPSDCSPSLETTLAGSNLPQARHEKFTRPSAVITRGNSAPSKAHSTGSR